MDQVRQVLRDATVFAKTLQQIYLEQQRQQPPASVASSIEPLLPILECYAPTQEVQAQLVAEQLAQAKYQETLATRRQREIKEFALHAPKFP